MSSGPKKDAKARCNRSKNKKVLRIKASIARGQPYAGTVLRRYGVSET